MENEDSRNKDDGQIKIRRPLWLKFAAGVVALLLLALFVDTAIISILVTGDVRVTAEANNYYTNQQRAMRVADTLQGDVDDTRLHLTILEATGSKAVRDMATTNFFRIHRNVAAVVVMPESEGSEGQEPETLLVNRAFFAVNKSSADTVNTFLSSAAGEFHRAALGDVFIRNVTRFLSFPALAIFFPAGGQTAQGAAVIVSTAQFNTDFGVGANQTLLVNETGEFIAHWDPSMLMSGSVSKAVQDAILGAGLDDIQTALRDDKGESYFYAIKKVPSLDAVVATQISQDIVFEGVRATVRRNIYLAALILSLSIGFAWFFSRTVTKPVQTLMKAAQQVEQGDYSATVPEKSGDELGVLGASFNSMNRSLEKTHRQLNEAYQRLQEVNEGLEQTVKMRTAELEHQTELAKAANKAKSEFLAMMSHEIRTPMNAIMGMVELIDPRNLTQKQAAYFKDIRTMSQALLNIINDVLDISRIESGKLDLVPVNYDICALFDNIMAISALTAANKSLSLESHKDEKLPRCLFGDETRVRQIFTNIVSNAIKYTPRGSVKVSIGAKPGVKGQQVVFTVKDTGIGIKKEDLPKLFDSFHRLDTQKTRAIQGTGLGLAITRQLLDMMGGNVYVESEYGKGTTFTITFPLIHGDEKQVKIEGELQQFIMVRPGASVRILVADDLQVNVTVVQGFLEKHGMRADTVRNGAEAIQKLQAMEERGQGYDLVFMDSLMPVMDGIEATKRIRALGGRFKTLPIVALSADATIDSVESYLKAGMNDFQPKPMSGSELNVMLGRWLPPEKVQTVQESQAWSRKERFSHPAGTPGSHAPVTPPPAHTPAPEPAPAFEYAAPRERAWGDPVMDALAGIPGLDVEQGMNFTGGKPEFYESALREFCDTFDDLFSGVSQDVAQRDWKEYSVKVHGLKGILAMLGATTLSEWARKLELAGKQAASEAATESARVEKEDSEKLCVEKTPVVMQRFAVFRNYVDRALNQKGAAA